MAASHSCPAATRRRSGALSALSTAGLCDVHGRTLQHVVDSETTLKKAKEFFEGRLSDGPESLADTYLQLARVYLYMGDFSKAREFAARYRNDSKAHVVPRRRMWKLKPRTRTLRRIRPDAPA